MWERHGLKMHLGLIIDAIDLVIINVFYKAFMQSDRKACRSAFFIVNAILAAGILVMANYNTPGSRIIYKTLVMAGALVLYRGNGKLKYVAAAIYAVTDSTLNVWEICLITLIKDKGAFEADFLIPYLLLVFLFKLIKLLVLLAFARMAPRQENCPGGILIPAGGILLGIIIVNQILSYTIMDSKKGSILHIIILSALTLMFLCFVYLLRIMDYLVETIKTDRLLMADYAYKEEYYSLLKQNQQKMEKLRHNYKNQLLGILGAVKQSRSAGEQEIEKVLGVVYSATKHMYTINYVLNSICQEKLRLAEEYNITVQCSLQLPEVISLNPIEMAVIYGNLLDNALEACIPVEPEIRKMDFYSSYKDNRLYIRLANSCKANEKYYLSGGDNEHGLGLASVEEIVKNHEGIMDINTRDDWYEVKIIIYVN